MGMMGAVFSLIGGVVQGIGQQQQFEAQAKQQEAQAKQAEAVAEAHDYNAAVAARNRDVIHAQTLAALKDQEELDYRAMATLRGKFAANGVNFTGSAMDVAMDDARIEALGRARIGYKGKVAEVEQTDKERLEKMAAAAQRVGAQAYMEQASASKSAGGISLVSGILGGFAGAANEFSRTA